MKLQQSDLNILPNEDSEEDWFSMLLFWFDKFNLVQLISNEVKLLGNFFINCTFSLFIVQILCHSVATTIPDLVPIGAVCLRLHCFSHYDWVGIFIPLSLSIDGRLYKAIGTFLGSLLNESMIFCPFKNQMQVTF